MMTLRWFVAFLATLLPAFAGAGPSINGFDLSGASVSIRDIHRGGPPRDGIPALDKPRFVGADAASFLLPEDRVLGVVLNGVHKAYPIKILNWHELVNDRFGTDPVLISYCPLCGSGMAFDARVDGRNLVFGVSGLLYNSDVLFYDRQTESLWSQIDRKAISGPMQPFELQQLPMTHSTWRKWRARHPDSLVLSDETGFVRDYETSPYKGYESSPQLFFRLAEKTSRRFHPKERVLGLRSDSGARAYPFVELEQQGLEEFSDCFDGREIVVRWDAKNRTAQAFDLDGNVLVSTDAFWFAWYAFHPQTEVFEHEG